MMICYNLFICSLNVSGDIISCSAISYKVYTASAVFDNSKSKDEGKNETLVSSVVHR